MHAQCIPEDSHDKQSWTTAVPVVGLQALAAAFSLVFMEGRTFLPVKTIFLSSFLQKKTQNGLLAFTSMWCEFSVSMRGSGVMPSDRSAAFFSSSFFLSSSLPPSFPSFLPSLLSFSISFLFYPPVCSLCRTSGFKSVAIFTHIIMLMGSEYQQLSAVVSHTSGKHSLKLSS